MSAQAEYEKLVASLDKLEGVIAGQMFGKPCLKINNKAFMAQHKEAVIFKLGSPQHDKAIKLDGAVLWDPSGAGRAMKEWVALPVHEKKHFKPFALAALEYVDGLLVAEK
jgi:hypothetical protein